MAAFTEFDGILLVDKPAGITSHDVVYKIRKHFGIDKVGHGGTLDPGASGLLVILLGKGTKLSDRIMGGNKAYTGILRLGTQTDTQDSDGEPVATADYSGVTEEKVREVLATFIGDQYQTPPMVSAIKFQGQPLYKLARQGQDVERKDRFIHIFEFALTSFNPPDCGISVICTKGAYVRTLCNDAGEKLGCHGHLDSLRRIRSGKFDVRNATPLADLLALSPSDLAARVIPMLRAQDYFLSPI